MNKFDITKTIGYSIMNTARYMSSHHSKLEGDITMAQGAVLYYLSRNNSDCMIQQDIAEIMDLNKSGLLRTIDILEKKGLLKRMPVENDRRKNKVELTEAGIATVDGFVKNIEQKDKELKSGFTDKEIEAFFKVMNEMKRKIEAKACPEE